MEKFCDEINYFAVYDGHGSSGKEVLIIEYDLKNINNN
jgi:hypothetical protein